MIILEHFGIRIDPIVESDPSIRVGRDRCIVGNEDTGVSSRMKPKRQTTAPCNNIASRLGWIGYDASFASHYGIGDGDLCPLYRTLSYATFCSALAVN